MSMSPLDTLIAAERRSPPRPEQAAATMNWARVRLSVAAGALAPFDLPLAAVAPTAVAPTAVAPAAVAPAAVAPAAVVPAAVVPAAVAPALVAGAGKLLIAVALGAGAVVSAVVVGGGDEGESMQSAPAELATAAQPVASVTERPSSADLPVAVFNVEEVVQTPATTPEEVVQTPATTPEEVAVEPPRAVAEDVRPAARRTQVPPVVVPNKSALRSTSSRAPRAAVGSVARKATGIGRELELITRASRAVNRRLYADALATLEECADEFPAGALREDRAALRAIALCESGQLGSGARAAAAFSLRFPRSVHTERVREVCSPVVE